MEKNEKKNHLTFTGNEKTVDGRKYGEFVCDCGNKKFIRLDQVIGGTTKSCGCLYKSRKNPFGFDSYKYSLLYNVWRNMLKRCENENSERYYTYGAKGIKVCDEWHDLDKFCKWAVENGWDTGLSIERKDITVGYCPENCTFILMAEQAKNKSNNIRLTINGEEKCLSEWCREFDFPFKTAWARYNRGYRDIESILYRGDLRRKAV